MNHHVLDIVNDVWSHQWKKQPFQPHLGLVPHRYKESLGVGFSNADNMTRDCMDPQYEKYAHWDTTRSKHAIYGLDEEGAEKRIQEENKTETGGDSTGGAGGAAMAVTVPPPPGIPPGEDPTMPGGPSPPSFPRREGQDPRRPPSPPRRKTKEDQKSKNGERTGEAGPTERTGAMERENYLDFTMAHAIEHARTAMRVDDRAAEFFVGMLDQQFMSEKTYTAQLRFKMITDAAKILRMDEHVTFSDACMHTVSEYQRAFDIANRPVVKAMLGGPGPVPVVDLEPPGREEEPSTDASMSTTAAEASTISVTSATSQQSVHSTTSVNAPSTDSSLSSAAAEASTVSISSDSTQDSFQSARSDRKPFSPPRVSGGTPMKVEDLSEEFLTPLQTPKRKEKETPKQAKNTEEEEDRRRYLEERDQWLLRNLRQIGLQLQERMQNKYRQYQNTDDRMLGSMNAIEDVKRVHVALKDDPRFTVEHLNLLGDFLEEKATTRALIKKHGQFAWAQDEDVIGLFIQDRRNFYRVQAAAEKRRAQRYGEDERKRLEEYERYATLPEQEYLNIVARDNALFEGWWDSKMKQEFSRWDSYLRTDTVEKMRMVNEETGITPPERQAGFETVMRLAREHAKDYVGRLAQAQTRRMQAWLRRERLELSEEDLDNVIDELMPTSREGEFLRDYEIRVLETDPLIKEYLRKTVRLAPLPEQFSANRGEQEGAAESPKEKEPDPEVVSMDTDEVSEEVLPEPSPKRQKTSSPHAAWGSPAPVSQGSPSHETSPARSESSGTTVETAESATWAAPRAIEVAKWDEMTPEEVSRTIRQFSDIMQQNASAEIGLVRETAVLMQWDRWARSMTDVELEEAWLQQDLLLPPTVPGRLPRPGQGPVAAALTVKEALQGWIRNSLRRIHPNDPNPRYSDDVLKMLSKPTKQFWNLTKDKRTSKEFTGDYSMMDEPISQFIENLEEWYRRKKARQAENRKAKRRERNRR